MEQLSPEEVELQAARDLLAKATERKNAAEAARAAAIRTQIAENEIARLKELDAERKKREEAIEESKRKVREKKAARQEEIRKAEAEKVALQIELERIESAERARKKHQEELQRISDMARQAEQEALLLEQEAIRGAAIRVEPLPPTLQANPIGKILFGNTEPEPAPVPVPAA